MNRFKIILCLAVTNLNLLPTFIAANAQSAVQTKNYPLLSLVEQRQTIKILLERDPILKRLNTGRNIFFSKGVSHISFDVIVERLKFGDTEVRLASAELGKLYATNRILVSALIKDIRASGAFSLYDQLSDSLLLMKAWKQDAAGINHAIAVYAGGQEPNYPAIDSMSFHDQKVLIAAAKKAVQGSQLFFQPGMRAALAFLSLNGRNNAGDYEPMEKTVNRAAFQHIKRIAWTKYPYSLVLVPGEGPEDTAAFAPRGKTRCDLAAEAYRKGLAPFIMVSGGKVHPYKTKFREAEEMKRYLVNQRHIPEAAVLMEPHARHTTTNLRNTVRLIYQYHFPVDKPALVLSDEDQSGYISQMSDRCLNELGNVPYRLGKRVSVNAQEFYPVWTAMQVNPWEPLDP